MTRFRHLWQYLRVALVPLLLVGLAVVTLREPVVSWLSGEERYDQDALKEWLLEAKVYQTLPEVVGDYLKINAHYRDLKRQVEAAKLSQRRLDADKQNHRDRKSEGMPGRANL